MAQNLVINGKTYSGVDKISFFNDKGEKVFFSLVEEKYTNVISLAIDKNGSIFNGGKGWADKSRIGSGGIYLGTSTSYVTGHIEVDPTIDNTFYLKNIVFDATTNDAPDGAYRYCLQPFDASFGAMSTKWYSKSDFAEFALSYSTVIKDNNIVQFTIPANKVPTMKYVALCCSYIGDDSIITINEPIE